LSSIDRLLHHLERENLMARLLEFPAMSIGVEAVISHRDSFGSLKLPEDPRGA
jgi:hypothetical protein